MRNIFVSAILTALTFCSCNPLSGNLPRGLAEPQIKQALQEYIEDVDQAAEEMHSIMIVQHGRVIAEHWWPGHDAEERHGMWSVSKTFTCMAVGMLIDKGLLSLDDKLVSFFEDKLPEQPSPWLGQICIRHLLTMSCGHSRDPLYEIWDKEGDWADKFLAFPIDYEPGTYFCYNSMCTYMLSAIVQKLTGQKVSDFLKPRLFDPLGIEGYTWDDSPQGICCGGWGLHIRTEDMAKMGQLLLQKGRWHGKQLVPASWVEQASSKQIDSRPAHSKPEDMAAWGFNQWNNDWQCGYGYQTWQCKYGGYRADGSKGQYIIVLPAYDAVIATTANVKSMNQEIKRIWKHFIPAFANSDNSNALNVVSFNMLFEYDWTRDLHLASGDSARLWERRAAVARETFDRYRFDIVGVQELMTFQLDSLTADGTYSRIGSDLGGKTRPRAENEAIVYRSDRISVLEDGQFWYSDTPDLPGSHWGIHTRACTWGHFKDLRSGKDFYLFNSHLHVDPIDAKWPDGRDFTLADGDSVRCASARLLLSKVDEIVPKGKTVFVTGDLNCQDESRPIHIIKDGGFTDTAEMTMAEGPRNTFHDFKLEEPSLHLDYVFVKGKADIRRHRVLTDQLEYGRWASDHLPVYVTVVL